MGAGYPRRARSALGYGILFSLAFGAVLFSLCQLFPRAAIGLFTPDPEVIFHGALYLRSYSIDCLLVAFVFCLNGFFGGCGRTTFTMANSLAATFLVRVPVVLLVSRMAGATMFHIGLAAPAASILQILLQLAYLKSGRWRHSVIDGGLQA